MKFKFKFIAALALLGAALFISTPSRAADYAVGKTFWSFNGTWTNVAGAVTTNLAAAIDCTQVSDFALQVRTTQTNSTSGGTVAIAWETSADGSNWPNGGDAAPGSKGWFSLSLTNSGTVGTLWSTNITVNAVGYWRIAWATNTMFQCATQASIVGYVKPKRTNRDY